MKRSFVLLSLCAMTVLALVSCQDDEGEFIETMYTGFLTGRTNSKGEVKTLKTDFGDTYTVTETEVNSKLRPDTTYRLVCSIALDGNNARIIQLVKPISYIAPPDSIIPDSVRVQDPVCIESRYVGGGFLNIIVGIKVQSEESKYKHEINYARLDTPGKYTFTIYHDAHGDGQVLTKHAYLSIPLYGYKGLAKNDTVFLKCKGYQEDYDIKLLYK